MCENAVGNGNSTVLPFEKATYVSLMETFQLPSEFLVVLHLGTPIFKRTDMRESSEGTWTFVMRMPLSNKNNWTVALSWDHSKLTTNALLHSFQHKELEQLKSVLNDLRSLPVHPLLLPVLLCELLTDSDSNEIKLHASNLYKVEVRTNYLRIDRRQTLLSSIQTHSNESGFEDLTRKLNAITSRFAFLESQVNANVKLVESVLKYTDQIDRHVKQDLRATLERQKEGWSEGQWRLLSKTLIQRLNNLQIEHSALPIEIDCNQKIA